MLSGYGIEMINFRSEPRFMEQDRAAGLFAYGESQISPFYRRQRRILP